MISHSTLLGNHCSEAKFCSDNRNNHWPRAEFPLLNKCVNHWATQTIHYSLKFTPMVDL